MRKARDRKLRAGRFRPKRLANELNESLALCQSLPAVVRLADLGAIFLTWRRADRVIVSHGVSPSLDEPKVFELSGEAVNVRAEDVSKLGHDG
jgi:hypothetical protein